MRTGHRKQVRIRGDNAYDIAIIVNHLLQNALEACGRMTAGERYVSLSGSRKNRFFLISVKNSFEGRRYLIKVRISWFPRKPRMYREARPRCMA